MVKLVSLFLIAIVVLAMFGRLRVPGMKGRKLSKPGTCPRCGRFRIGRGPCPCETKT
ncbi:hypothetical protein [Acidimangrovimonas sediminis]|uniref:hypothetical protein n=1 Tax=Acidimangrovimonas sediminis TaxID=2056283 RepID=UPI0018EC5C7D|nr:hypothetical protein [Acidimangrovimonas sediminis]